MNYEASCPKCGRRLSRWHYFTTWRVYFLCRSCGARFRMTLVGYLVYLAAFAIQFLWFGLTLRKVIPPLTGMIMVVLTCLLGLWLFPWLTPMKLPPEK
jgi:hypothetical protein